MSNGEGTIEVQNMPERLPLEVHRVLTWLGTRSHMPTVNRTLHAATKMNKQPADSARQHLLGAGIVPKTVHALIQSPRSPG